MATGEAMCRNIRKLRQSDRLPTNDELHDAALQFVRKISGYRVPSTANREAFAAAVDDVSAAARRMFDRLELRRSAPRAQPPQVGMC
jgi:hypothetical protein